MEVKKFAAIDIGSNAVRLLIVNVIEGNNKNKPNFNKSTLIRTPVRLGDDVFNTGYISEKKVDKLILTLQAFTKLMEVHEVLNYRACATSAMREAKNGNEVIAIIKEKTGINIEIISGKEEAELLFLSGNIENIEDGKKYLSADLGGGSLEFNLFTRKEIVVSKSFNIGTVRMLNNQVQEIALYELKKWLKGLKNKHNIHKLIGSGGNINKLFKISETRKNETLKYKKLKNLYQYLDSFNYDDRIKILQLNTDRADVIMPAAEIFIQVMKWTEMKEILVPVIGLSDGIVKQVYENYLKNKDNGKKVENKTKS